MKGWQAAAGFLGVGTVISLLSLIGDTTSYDETKYTATVDPQRLSTHSDC